MECSASVVDASSDSNLQSGDLEFGIEVTGCRFCRVWFTVDIAYGEGIREYQASAQSDGKSSFSLSISVDPRVKSISDAREIRCDCLG